MTEVPEVIGDFFCFKIYCEIGIPQTKELQEFYNCAYVRCIFCVSTGAY